jgi:hypothetical protein
MKISKATFDALTRETFVNNFFTLLASQGEDVNEPRTDPEVRRLVWQIAQDASRLGIQTVGGSLVFVQIHWELGLDCLTRMAGLALIAEDAALPERSKIEQLWEMRCDIFEALGAA